MKYCSASFIVLASAALLTACGGEAGSDVSAPQETSEAEISVEEEATEIAMADDGADVTDVEIDDHDHDDEGEDHDHAHEDHSGDEPDARLGSHTHGHATLAVTRQGSSITVALEAPLSAFGVTENPQTEEDRAAIEAIRNDLTNDANLVVLRGNVSCDISSKGMATRVANGHGELQMETSYSCQNADALQAIRFGGFGTYPALSEVEAVYVSDTEQAAGNLTRANPELRIN